MFPKNPFDPFDRTVRRMIESSTLRTASASQSIDEEDGTLRITIDIPGAEKDDIDLKVEEKSRWKVLKLDVSSEKEDISRHYRQEIPLRAPINEELGDAEYNNGILTVRFPILEDSDSGTNIEIK